LTYFLDASALVKRYVREPGSDRIHALIRRRAELLLSRISAVEVPAGLWKRCRAGDMAVSEARRLTTSFESDLLQINIVEPRPATLALAAALVERHPLRAYDAVQLASGLRWARETGIALTFVCADVRLATVARHEKIRAMLLG
jgi:hypothetical protein